MPRLIWDKTGERFYETGVKNGVLYVYDSETKKYGKGVPWNGLISVTESPSGAEASPLYADDIKYLNLMSAEEFGATIEAYSSPEEFDECDGTASIGKGVSIGQQKRKMFALCYRTALGNDVDGEEHGYKIHIIYGAIAAPTERAYQSINDSPEAMTLSWELTTTPVEVKGHKPTACVVIDSTKADAAKLTQLEDKLYGKDSEGEPTLLLPDEIATLMAAS